MLDASGGEIPRAVAAAAAYLDAAGGSFTEEGLAAFLDGYQKESELDMAEVWALKPALQLAHLRNIAASEPSQWPVLIASLRHASETTWKEFFESVNVVDQILALDAAGAYVNMDYDSREGYRTAISGLAKHSKSSEHDVAAAALVLAQRGEQRRAHVGFYLVDRGLPELRQLIGYRAPFSTRLRDAIMSHPNAFYLVGVELITFIIVLGLLSALDAISPVVAGFLLLILPATQAAVEFMNHLTTSLLRPRALPKLDFSEGIPADCAAIVAVPTLLLNEAQVANLVLDLEIRYLANRDPNLYFALLTDSPDSDRPDEKRDSLVDLAVHRIEELNRRYGSNGRTPFYLLHRHRTYNPAEGRWMGWERKRGKLLDLNQFVRGGYDSFPVKVGQSRRVVEPTLCHHARFRHATAARFGSEADRRDRSSSEPRCNGPGFEDGGGRLRDSAAAHRHQH